MNHKQAIEVRAYTMRYTSPAKQERSQIEAEVIALNNGDPAEALRRRNARLDLGEKQKQRLARMERLGIDTGWIIRDLGGARDPIAMMLKARELSISQALAALMLREYESAEVASFNGAGMSERVDGGFLTGMDARIMGLTPGRMAKQRAMEAVDGADWQAVYLVILGRSMRQARRVMRCDNTKAHKRLSDGVEKALDAAGAYMEIRAA